MGNAERFHLAPGRRLQLDGQGRAARDAEVLRHHLQGVGHPPPVAGPPHDLQPVLHELPCRSTFPLGPADACEIREGRGGRALVLDVAEMASTSSWQARAPARSPRHSRAQPSPFRDEATSRGVPTRRLTSRLSAKSAREVS